MHISFLALPAPRALSEQLVTRKSSRRDLSRGRLLSVDRLVLVARVALIKVIVPFTAA